MEDLDINITIKIEEILFKVSNQSLIRFHEQILFADGLNRRQS
jgi:hypothetical protein